MQRKVALGEIGTYSVALTQALNGRVIASILCGTVARWQEYNRATGKGNYVVMSVSYVHNNFHPEFTIDQIRGGFELLVKKGFLECENLRCKDGKWASNKYWLSEEAKKFFPEYTNQMNPQELTPDMYNKILEEGRRIERAHQHIGEKAERKAKREEKEKIITEQIREVVEHLNEVAQKHFKPGTAATDKYIRARLREGFSPEQMKAVIDYKTAEWKNQIFTVNGKSKSASHYLRPQTLFGENFQSYLNEIPEKIMEVESSNKNDEWDENKVRTLLWKYGVFYEDDYGDVAVDKEKLQTSDIQQEAMGIAKRLLGI